MRERENEKERMCCVFLLSSVHIRSPIVHFSLSYYVFLIWIAFSFVGVYLRFLFFGVVVFLCVLCFCLCLFLFCFLQFFLLFLLF